MRPLGLIGVNNVGEEARYEVEDVKDMKVWVCCPVCGDKLFTGKSFEDINIKCGCCGSFIEAHAKHLNMVINVASLRLKR